MEQRGSLEGLACSSARATCRDVRQRAKEPKSQRAIVSFDGKTHSCRVYEYRLSLSDLCLELQVSLQLRGHRFDTLHGQAGREHVVHGAFEVPR